MTKTSDLVLFVCAGLHLGVGAVLAGWAAWALICMNYYFWTTDLGVELTSGILLVAGSVLCLPACWLSTLVPYHKTSFSLQGTLMLVVTCGMLLLSSGLTSLTGLSRTLRNEQAINASMLKAMSSEYFDPSVRRAFSAMQLELHCCGVQSYQDWHNLHDSLPPSCCGRVANGKEPEICEMPSFHVGCLRPALAQLRAYNGYMTLLTCVVIIIMVITLFTSVYILASSTIHNMTCAICDKRRHPPQLLTVTVPCYGKTKRVPSSTSPPLAQQLAMPTSPSYQQLTTPTSPTYQQLAMPTSPSYQP